MTQSPVPYCYVYYTGRRFLHCNNLRCVGSDVGFTDINLEVPSKTVGSGTIVLTSSLQNQSPRAGVRLQILRNTVTKMTTIKSVRLTLVLIISHPYFLLTSYNGFNMGFHN